MSLMLLVVLTLAVAPPTVFAQDLPKIDVNISTNDGGTVWYKNPIIIGGGVLALVLIAVLAGRGGTTVVKS
jgi:hypothetical protein